MLFMCIAGATPRALLRVGSEEQKKRYLPKLVKGEMLTAGSYVKGSAGYVAVERFSGTLQGRTGTFALMHMGVMTRGTPQLTIMVVPDSGTGQLVGLTGTLMINIADGKHSYDFEYSITLP